MQNEGGHYEIVRFVSMCRCIGAQPRGMRPEGPGGQLAADGFAAGEQFPGDGTAV